MALPINIEDLLRFAVSTAPRFATWEELMNNDVIKDMDGVGREWWNSRKLVK